MKIGIFAPEIYDITLHKDVGQIGEGFRDLGHEVVFLTLHKKISEDKKFEILEVSFSDLFDKKFWEGINLDLLIFYSWLSYRFFEVLKFIKDLKIKLIIKSDTDGHIAPPLKPSYTRVAGYFENTKDFYNWILKNILWFIKDRRFFYKKLKQIEFSDYTIVESPSALRNIALSLYCWELQHLNAKLEMIPNPVCDDINDKQRISDIKKENLVISVSNFKKRHKNKIGLARAISEFLKIRKDYSAVLIGNGSEELKRYIDKGNSFRVDFYKEIEHEHLRAYYDKSKIFFMPSLWEGFPLSAAEAVTRGCSIVGTPLEALEFLTKNGFSGTLSYDISLKSVISALLLDSIKWDRNEYDPIKIANYWSEILDRRNIAKLILEKLR